MQKSSHVSHFVKLSWGTLGSAETSSCSDQHSLVGEGSSPPHHRLGVCLLAALSILLGFTGSALHVLEPQSLHWHHLLLGPRQPGSTGYCLFHPGMCRQAGTSGSFTEQHVLL